MCSFPDLVGTETSSYINIIVTATTHELKVCLLLARGHMPVQFVTKGIYFHELPRNAIYIEEMRDLITH